MWFLIQVFVFRIDKKLQLRYPSLFRNIFLGLRGFHMEIIWKPCFGSYLLECGVTSKSLVVTSKTVAVTSKSVAVTSKSGAVTSKSVAVTSKSGVVTSKNLAVPQQYWSKWKCRVEVQWSKTWLTSLVTLRMQVIKKAIVQVSLYFS